MAISSVSSAPVTPPISTQVASKGASPAVENDGDEGPGDKDGGAAAQVAKSVTAAVTGVGAQLDIAA